MSTLLKRLDTLYKLHNRRNWTIQQFNREYDVNFLSMSDDEFSNFIEELEMERNEQNLFSDRSH